MSEVMTGPIAFTALNKPTSTESSDMPHVLGDPSDINWKGHAERSNDNFAAINAYADTLIAAVKPAAELTNAAVITPASGWGFGWAYASQLTLPGARVIQLEIYLGYTGATVYTSGADSAWSPSAPVIGTVPAQFRPAGTLYWRNCGYYYNSHTTYQDWGSCDIGITTAGVVTLYRGSNDNGALAKNGYAFLNKTYVLP